MSKRVAGPGPRQKSVKYSPARCLNITDICVTLGAKRSDGPERRPLEAGGSLQYFKEPSGKAMQSRRPACKEHAS